MEVKEKMNYIATLHTHFDAIQYSKFLATKNIRCTLQPVPRSLSSSCGTCVSFSTEVKLENFADFIYDGLDALYQENLNPLNSEVNGICKKKQPKTYTCIMSF